MKLVGKGMRRGRLSSEVLFCEYDGGGCSSCDECLNVSGGTNTVLADVPLQDIQDN